MTLNELVKLTTLWTTGPSIFQLQKVPYMELWKSPGSKMDFLDTPAIFIPRFRPSWFVKKHSICSLFLTLVLLNPDMPSQTDLELHCLSFSLWICIKKKVREKSRECHNDKPQPFPDTKRKRKPTNPNKHKPNKCTKSTKISSLFPKRGNRNTKRTKKHKNKMTHGKTYNKSPRRINHKATKSKTNKSLDQANWLADN